MSFINNMATIICHRPHTCSDLAKLAIGSPSDLSKLHPSSQLGKGSSQTGPIAAMLYRNTFFVCVTKLLMKIHSCTCSNAHLSKPSRNIRECQPCF